MAHLGVTDSTGRCVAGVATEGETYEAQLSISQVAQASRLRGVPAWWPD